MARIPNSNTIICDGCGAEITWVPVAVGQRLFCCQLCAEGRPCRCDFPAEEPSQASPVPQLTTA